MMPIICLVDVDQAGFRSVFHLNKGRCLMLETIVVILLILWLLGLVTSYTMGGLIHVLLVIAVVVILIRLIQGRRIL
jgi:hypothetical protein